MNPIIMPWIDNQALTQVAIYDILAQTVPDLTLLTIDNGSRQGEWLQSWAPSRVLQWRHDPPLPSLAATWNRALRWAWDAGADHAWVVNNDVRLPRGTYESLLEVCTQTRGWLVSADNVGPAWYDGMLGQRAAITPDLLASRGGPDFSCFLITRECHHWFQFDEHFVPAYHEDNDYHRRLQLAGFGDRIFGVPVPYYHIGSATLQADEQLRASWGPKFARCQQYYVSKWGGLPGQETYDRPFNLTGEGADSRALLTGQGRPGEYVDDVRGLSGDTEQR